jgi:AcrR family transcriptional regulator
VPRLWQETIDAHRHEVRDAIVHATAALIAERGLLSVTMAEIAERAGIGRATLYRYFSDVEAVLLAWHEEQIAGHVAQLTGIRDRAEANRRLDVVLEALAVLSHEAHGHQDPDLVAFLHRGQQVERARDEVRALIRDLISEAANSGVLRDDIAPDELAAYCVHALSAAASMRSKAAVRRLVNVTLDGLRPRT